jgi:hypothetical protein
MELKSTLTEQSARATQGKVFGMAYVTVTGRKQARDFMAITIQVSALQKLSNLTAKA